MNIQLDTVCYYSIESLIDALTHSPPSDTPIKLNIYQCSEQQYKVLYETIQAQPFLLSTPIIIQPASEDNERLHLLLEALYWNYKKTQFLTLFNTINDPNHYYNGVRQKDKSIDGQSHILSSLVIKQHKINTPNPDQSATPIKIEDILSQPSEENTEPLQAFRTLHVLREVILDQDIITPMHPLIDTELPFLLEQVLPFGATRISRSIQALYLKFKSAFDNFYALKEPADKEIVIQHINNIDQELKKFLKKLPLPLSLIHMTIRYVITDEKEQAVFTSFLTEGSLIYFLNESLEKAFLRELNNSINQLEPNAPSLNVLFTGCIGPFNLTCSISEALTLYLEQIDSVYSFMEQLFIIKQKDKEAYQHMLNLLTVSGSKELLTLLIRRFKIIESRLLKSLPLSQQLELIVHALRNNPGTIDKLDKALNTLSILKEAESTIPSEILSFLMSTALNYEFIHSNHFPIHALIKLQQLKIDHQDHTFFTLLLNGIHKTSNHSELQQLLVDSTFAAMSQYIEQDIHFNLFVGLLLLSCTQFTEQKLKSYRYLLGNIPHEPEKRAFWVTILSALARHGADISELEKVHNGLISHDNNLQSIALLFETQPYPEMDVLLNYLEKTPQELLKFIHFYDRDPAQIRTNPENIAAQFSLEMLPEVLGAVQLPLSNTYLPEEKQYELIQELTYITMLGRDTITKDTPALINKSRIELQQEFSQLVHDLRDNPQNQLLQRKQTLELIACLRELFYRSTGHFPYLFQIMVLLLSLDNETNLLFEIETGEGKSIITALLAVLKWIEGGTVGVSLAHQSLIQQDYEERKIRYFFDALGIPNIAIKNENTDILVNGINYSTVDEFICYEAKNRLELHSKSQRKTITHLIVDECDTFLLDNPISLNLLLDDARDVAWIYPHLNEFITKEQFRLIEDNQSPWNRKEEIWQLKKYLLSVAKNKDQNRQADSFSIQQLDQWLDGAYKAQQLKINTHYIIKHAEPNALHSPLAQIIPLIQGVPKPEHTFSNPILHCLHTHLQKTYPYLSFPLEPENSVVVSESSRNFMEFFNNGHIICLTATAGTPGELNEQKNYWNMTCISIPPHKKNKREMLGSMICTPQDHMNHIKQFIASLPQTPSGRQPILLIAKGVEESQKLYHHLEIIYPDQVCLILNEEQQNQNLIRAGRPNQITISTFLLGRGADIEPKHEKGLLVIQTYLDSYRRTQQILGRCARNGQVGQYIAFYAEQQSVKYICIDKMLFLDKTRGAQTIKKLQDQINQKASIQRHALYQVDSIQKILLQYLDNWYAFILSISREKQEPLKNQLLIMRKELISSLRDRWNILSIRYNLPPNSDDLFSTLDLNKALNEYESQDITVLFNETKNQLILLTQQCSPLSSIDNLRLNFLKNITIDYELAIRHYSKKIQANKDAKRNRLKRPLLRFALNEESVLLRFGDHKLNENEKEVLQLVSQKKQIQSITAFYNKQIKKIKIKNNPLTFYHYDNELSATENFIHLTAQLNKAKLISTTYRHLLYPVILECSHISESLNIPQKTNKQLRQLKAHVIDNAMDELSQQIIAECAWVERKGIDYYFERSSVCEAAQEILALAKKITNPLLKEQKNTHIQLLHEALQRQQVQVNSLWFYFSLGHKDIRTIINTSLNQYASLKHIHGVVPIKNTKESIERHRYKEKELRVKALLEDLYGKEAVAKVIIKPFSQNTLFSSYKVFIYKPEPYKKIEGFTYFTAHQLDQLKEQLKSLLELQDTIHALSLKENDTQELIKKHITNHKEKAYFLHELANWKRAHIKLQELEEKMAQQQNESFLGLRWSQMTAKQIKENQEAIITIKQQIEAIETKWNLLKSNYIAHCIQEPALNESIEEQSQKLTHQIALLENQIKSYTEQEAIAVRTFTDDKEFESYLTDLERQIHDIKYADFVNSYTYSHSNQQFFKIPNLNQVIQSVHQLYSNLFKKD